MEVAYKVYNQQTRKDSNLRNLIGQMLQVKRNADRPDINRVLNHPYLAMALRDNKEYVEFGPEIGPEHAVHASNKSHPESEEFHLGNQDSVLFM